MLTLSLVTPAKKLVTDTPVEAVFVPSFKGELNILEGHAPLISTLETGVLRYQLKGETQIQEVAISWGYLEVSNDQVVVLAETAERPEEINLERARLAQTKAEKALSSSDLEHHEFQKYQLKLQRAVTRLQMTKDTTKEH